MLTSTRQVGAAIFQSRRWVDRLHMPGPIESFTVFKPNLHATTAATNTRVLPRWRSFERSQHFYGVIIFGAVVAETACGKKHRITKTIPCSPQPGQQWQRAPRTGIDIEGHEWQNAEAPIDPSSFAEAAGQQKDALQCSLGTKATHKHSFSDRPAEVPRLEACVHDDRRQQHGAQAHAEECCAHHQLNMATGFQRLGLGRRHWRGWGG